MKGTCRGSRGALRWKSSLAAAGTVHGWPFGSLAFPCLVFPKGPWGVFGGAMGSFKGVFQGDLLWGSFKDLHEASFLGVPHGG